MEYGIVTDQVFSECENKLIIFFVLTLQSCICKTSLILSFEVTLV